MATGRTVLREIPLPGAVLARVAGSHLRVGSFQYARAAGDVDLLRRLADHAISRHYPGVAEVEQRYLALFEAVVGAQASLIAQSMLVGFVHGVMNTDNMTISGETIDYGPARSQLRDGGWGGLGMRRRGALNVIGALGNA